MNAPAFVSMIDNDAAKIIIQAFDEAEKFVNAVTR
jgi:hypothetical protein